MRHDVLPRPDRLGRHPQRRKRPGLRVQRIARRPADDVPRKHVHHQRQVDEALLGVDVRDVRAERLVRGRDLHPLDEVRRRDERRVLPRRAAAERLPGPDEKPVAPEQLAEAVAPDADAGLPQFGTDRGEHLPRARAGVHAALLPHEGEDQPLVDPLAGADLGGLVERGPAHPEPAADGAHGAPRPGCGQVHDLAPPFFFRSSGVVPRSRQAI